MRKPPPLPTLVAALVFAPGLSVALAEDRPQDPPDMVREIFVPFEDLNVLLENQPRRVLLGRAEYEELLARAKRSPESRAPRDAVIVSAEYEGTVEDERATITGTLVVDVLEDGLHAVGLHMEGVGLRSATLDDKGASIGLADDGRLVLFVEGQGLHRLLLDVVAPLETTAARQVLSFQVPTPGATRMRLTVPGDVEVKSGAEVVSRLFDETSGVTRFELLPQRAKVSLVMTLNSRLKRVERVVIARSVLVDEVTEAYERLHLTSSMAILHKAVDSFQFAVPEGFEITQVRSPQLARWGVRVEDRRRTLDIRLREPTTETVVLSVSAIRTGSRPESWGLPRIEPLDVVGQPTVVGLLLEDRLRATAIVAEKLIPINTGVLTRALPATVFEAEPGAPQIRPVLAYYAPRAGFSLTARFDRPAPRLLVTTNLLLVLEERGQQVRGGFALLPDAEKLFDFDFLVPAGWSVTSVTAANNLSMPIERYREPNEATRVHVRLPGGIPPGWKFRVYFRAEQTPTGWPGDWESMPVTFPVCTVLGATREEGAIAVAVHDDLSVHPQTLEHLTPLDEDEKGDYGLADVGTNLAYRFEDPGYQAELIARRIAPRLTARSYSFFTIEPEVLVAHYEIAYDVEEARTRQLELVLDEATPVALSIRGLDGVGLKEYSSTLVDRKRRWTVLLAESQRGTIRLAVDFQQPLTDRDHQNLTLPVVLAEGVAYQSGIVAIEGSAEADVQVDSELRKVDVGELVDADYQPGKRLLGAYGFVGAAPEVKISVVRRPVYALPAVIVARAELVTSLSTDGASHTAARYQLRTKASLLEVQLPPGASLWSAELDGRPAKPLREGGKLLLSLPADAERAFRDLRIVYEAPVAAVAFLADVALPAPTLWLRAREDATSQEVPIADLLWHLYLPTGTHVVRPGGTVVTNQVSPPAPAIVSMAKFLYRLSGGVNLFYGAFGSLSRARELAHRVRMDRPVSAPTADVKGIEMEEAEIERLRALGYVGDVQGVDETRARSGRGRTRQDVAPPADKPTTPTKKVARGDWALRGFRSLKIDLESTGGRQITFQSLGGEPRLAVTLANRRRFDALAWGLALAVGLVGLAGTQRPVRSRALYLAIIGLVTTLLPLVGVLPELTQVCNMCFYAACLLMLWYLIAGLASTLGGWVRRLRAPVAVTTGIAVLSVLTSGSTSYAEPPRELAPGFSIAVVETPAPVTVPDDALILPYDPESPSGLWDADQLLVPYDRFVDLWNHAYPEKKIEAERPPVPYALAGALFNAALEGDEFLLVEGFLDVDVYAKGHVTIPLAIEGGVLARAELDGRPARLGIAQPPSNTKGPPSQSVRPGQRAETTTGPILVLYASEKGRHRLELTVRMRVQRRGGWRVVTGRLPTAPASQLALRAPHPKTEVRLSGVCDRRSYVTRQPDELIKTTPGADGAFTLQWRPKVGEGIVDQSVTATSTAVLNVQEDGFRTVWHVALQLRNDEREFFSLQVPEDYLVTQVKGDNIRGWEVRPAEHHQQLAISLLNPAKGREDFTVHLWQGSRFGEGSFMEFDAPMVRVDGAALHHGQLVIRRSPLLDVRTISTASVTRSDMPARIEDSTDDGERSPLGIHPHAAYRFAAMPCSVRLSASPVRSMMSADVQTVLRIAERKRNLEVRFDLHIRDRRRHHLDLLLPAEMDVEHVSAPGTFEWSLTEADDQKLLSVHLATGRMGDVPIVVRGTLGQPGAVDEVHLPKLEVLDVERQQGDIVVQVDPSFDVRATDLKGCETVLLERAYGWLNANQRQLARLALHYRSSDYRGVLCLSARQPAVTCHTISNVRVTDRALEETILLNFSIRHAGIRELSFLLPARMKDARISVPLLRQKTVEPGPAEPGPMVRVRLTLQDAVMDELRVLVEDDRLLTRDVHAAPVPIVETGRTDGRYVVLESAGRDEVVVEKQENLETLSRQQKEWRVLVGILGSGLSNAYLVGGGAREPLLSFMIKDRKTVETVGARIELAQTQLVLDANGAYRAAHTYRIHNTTEQFLEIELPSGAALWTAQVAGEPAKPAEVQKPAKPRHVRIPLVKTAAGDLDYTVLLKYGGSLAALGRWSSVELPLIRSVNINAELSQVRLLLPEGYHWFDFDGTMRLVESEGALAAGYVSYQTKLAKRLSQTMQSADSFAQLRAASNLKRLKNEIGAYRGTTTRYGADRELREAWMSNTVTLQGAEQQVKALEMSMAQEVARDNRSDLNLYYERQRAARSGDAVKDLDQNFGDALLSAGLDADESAEQFDGQWLVGNRLSGATERELGEETGRIAVGVQQEEQADRTGEPVARPPAPQAAQRQMMQQLQEAVSKERHDEQTPQSRKKRKGRRETVQQYQAALEEQVAERPPPGPQEDRDAFFPPAQVPRGAVVRADEEITLPAGLASLDVEIPARGTVYRFATPRGEMQIRARAVSRPFVANLELLGITALIIVVVSRVYRFVHNHDFLETYARNLTTVMIIAGLISVATGILPVAGLVVTIGGLVWKVHVTWSLRRLAEPAD